MPYTRLMRVVAGASIVALVIPGCETSSTPSPMPVVSPPSVTAPVFTGASGSAVSPGAGMIGNAGASAGAGAATAAGAGGAMLDVGAGAAGSSSTQMPPVASGGSGGTSGAGAETAAYRASIKVPRVAPNQEGTVCIQVRLDNATPINVVRLHNTLSVASHHFIVSKVTEPGGAATSIAPCTPFRGAVRGAPLTITQKHDDDVILPAGVSYSLAASQVMHLELHYLNVASEAVDVEATTELFVAPAQAQLQEASVMLIGTGDIEVAPHTTASTGPKYIALPDGMQGVHFFAITGHTHRFGTNVQVSSAAGPNQRGTLLYAPAPFVWDAPETKQLQPAATVPAGGGFSFECTWNNPSDSTIGFGESALAEMCFFWAYYYPTKPVPSVLLDGLDLGLFLGAL
jgi:hypothetical protein